MRAFSSVLTGNRCNNFLTYYVSISDDNDLRMVITYVHGKRTDPFR